MEDDAVICAIVKKEQLYIDEWIQYHLKLGFAHLYLYDNDEQEPIGYLADRYSGKVSVIPFHGRCLQMFCYYKFIQDFRDVHRWVAFIDVDEFIVLKKHKTIVDLLHEHCQQGALALNWVMFGSSGLEKYDPRPVLERFQRRQNGVYAGVKWIACLKDVVQMDSPHHGRLRSGELAHDCKGNSVEMYDNVLGDDEIACIHHYFTKSKQEFLDKCRRGRADIAEYRTFETDFARHDFNDVQDSTAWDFVRSTQKTENC